MQVYLDVDGVIGDFVSAALEATGIPLTTEQVRSWDFYKPYMTDDEFWTRIKEYHEFWLGIEPYPWAQAVVNACGNDVVFCTSPGWDSAAASQKIDWLIAHGFLKGSWDTRYVITNRKHLLANPTSLLIDDHKVNVARFEEALGQALLFPANWNLRAGVTSDTAAWEFAQSLERVGRGQWLH